MSNVVATAACTTEWKITQSEIASVTYRFGTLMIEVCEPGSDRALLVQFEEVEAFRVLDERDLPEFWPACSSPNGGVFKISSGGWLSQEMDRLGSAAALIHNTLIEYLVSGINECVSVLTAAEPTIKKLHTTQQRSVADLGKAFLSGEAIEGVAYSFNDYVVVIEGQHAGASGSLVSLLTIHPEPIFVVELESGIDADVRQSEVRLAHA